MEMLRIFLASFGLRVVAHRQNMDATCQMTRQDKQLCQEKSTDVSAKQAIPTRLDIMVLGVASNQSEDELHARSLSSGNRFGPTEHATKYDRARYLVYIQPIVQHPFISRLL